MTLLLLASLIEVEKTRCQHEREHILGAVDPQRPRPPGLFVPECDEHGHYAPTQCHGSTGYCWCVDRDGREVEGTRTTPGMRPPCKSEDSAGDRKSQHLQASLGTLAGDPCQRCSWHFLPALNPDLLHWLGAHPSLPFSPLQPPFPSPHHLPTPTISLPTFPLLPLTLSSSFLCKPVLCK